MESCVMSLLENSRGKLLLSKTLYRRSFFLFKIYLNRLWTELFSLTDRVLQILLSVAV